MKIAKGAGFASRTKDQAPSSRQAAGALAGQVLAYLAQDIERLERFFSLTGVDPADVRRLVREPGFQLALLDHLAGDEALLLNFAAHEGVEPETVGRARRALGGGEE